MRAAVLGGMAMTLATMAIGCGGGSSGGTPDGAPPDGAPFDAPATVDAMDCGGGGAVTVEGPTAASAVTLTVVAHNASGDVCHVASGSGSDALVTIDVPLSGMVTMIADATGQPRVRITWTHVSAGDHLRVPSSGSRQVPVEVAVTADANASAYDGSVYCQHSGAAGITIPQPGTIAGTAPCTASSQQVAAEVYADTATGRRFAVGAPTAIAATGPTAIALGPWADAAKTTVSVHGAGAFGKSGAAFGPRPTAEFGGHLDIAFGAGADPKTLGPESLPPTWGLSVTVDLWTTGQPPTIEVTKSFAAPPAAVDLTLADFPPTITATVDKPWPRAQVTWSAAAAFDGADLAAVDVDGWLMFAPAQPGALRYPDLPADLAPTGAGALKTLTVVDAAGVDGYDAARADTFGTLYRLDGRRSYVMP